MCPTNSSAAEPIAQLSIDDEWLDNPIILPQGQVWGRPQDHDACQEQLFLPAWRRAAVDGRVCFGAGPRPYVHEPGESTNWNAYSLQSRMTKRIRTGFPDNAPTSSLFPQRTGMRTELPQIQDASSSV